MDSVVYQRYHDVGLVFGKDVKGKQECTGYVDSEYAGDLDKPLSTTGYAFTLTQAPMSWCCTLHSTVYSGSVDDKSMGHGSDRGYGEAIWLQGLMDDLEIE